MPSFTNRVINAHIVESHGVSASHIDFQPFENLPYIAATAPEDEQEEHRQHELRILRQAIRNDIQFLRGHELVINDDITGYVLDIRTGKLEKVTE